MDSKITKVLWLAVLILGVLSFALYDAKRYERYLVESVYAQLSGFLADMDAIDDAVVGVSASRHDSIRKANIAALEAIADPPADSDHSIRWFSASLRGHGYAMRVKADRLDFYKCDLQMGLGHPNGPADECIRLLDRSQNSKARLQAFLDGLHVLLDD